VCVCMYVYVYVYVCVHVQNIMMDLPHVYVIMSIINTLSVELHVVVYM
jgi:hypothetical protein